MSIFIYLYNRCWKRCSLHCAMYLRCL